MGKFDDYKMTSALKEYVLVDQKHMNVECFRRKGDLWVLEKYGAGDHVEFASIEFICPIEFLYEDAERFVQ